MILLSGGLWPASRQSGPDGAKVQSIMGSPEGHCETWDETGIETKNVRLPQRLCRENHYFEDCTPKNNQQVCSGLDQMTPCRIRLNISSIMPKLHILSLVFISVSKAFFKNVSVFMVTFVTLFKLWFCQRIIAQWCDVFSTHRQVSCLSAVPGPSDICSTWGQHSSV